LFPFYRILLIVSCWIDDKWLDCRLSRHKGVELIDSFTIYRHNRSTLIRRLINRCCWFSLVSIMIIIRIISLKCRLSPFYRMTIIKEGNRMIRMMNQHNMNRYKQYRIRSNEYMIIMFIILINYKWSWYYSYYYWYT